MASGNKALKDLLEEGKESGFFVCFGMEEMGSLYSSDGENMN